MSEEKAQSLAMVAKVLTAFKVVINRGSTDGVEIGDRFLIFGYGDEITDPDTGESLGTLEVVKGIGKVSHVQDRIATVESAKTRKPEPRVKRTRRESGFGIGMMLGHPDDETVEERQGEPVAVPYDDVKEGDRARPL